MPFTQGAGGRRACSSSICLLLPRADACRNMLAVASARKWAIVPRMHLRPADPATGRGLALL